MFDITEHLPYGDPEYYEKSGTFANVQKHILGSTGRSSGHEHRKDPALEEDEQ